MIKEPKRNLKQESKLKETYNRLADKTGFALSLSQRLEEANLIGAPRTILYHWFGSGRLSGDMPTDTQRLDIIKDELKKAPKKQ